MKKGDKQGGRDNVFLIPFSDRFLLYAPLHRVTAILNDTAAEAIKAALTSNACENLRPELQPLASKLLSSAIRPPIVGNGQFSPRRIALILTNDCNLRCLYCAPAAGGKNVSHLPPYIAEAALRLYADIAARDGLSHYSLYLHGGEPFLNPARVRFCIETAEKFANRLGISLRATATTNGYMSDDLAEWVADHFFQVIVSLDGPPEIQNRQRPVQQLKTTDNVDSFARIARTLDIFRNRGLSFGIRCTVSDESVRHIPEIAHFLCHRFAPAIINFEPLTFWGRCHRTGIAAPDLETFVKGIIAASDILASCRTDLMLARCDTRQILHSNCGVADDQMVITPDGCMSACFGTDSANAEGADMFIYGRYAPEQEGFHINWERLEQIRMLGVEHIPGCAECFCKWHCAGGCRMIHTPVLSKEPTAKASCEMTRKLTFWRLLRAAGVSENLDELTDSV